MHKVNFELFKGYAVRGTEMDYNVLDAIERFVDQSDTEIFYPKHLYVNDKPLEVYFFKNNKIVVVYESQQEVVIKTFRYDQVKNVEFTYQGHYKPLSLKIIFLSGEEILLSGECDTNSAWSNRFDDKVIEIFKLFQ